MTIDVSVTDGNNKVVVDEAGALCVRVTPDPPVAHLQSEIYRVYLTDSAGSNDMQVSSDTDFSVRAVTDGDLWITSLSFTIADGGAALNEFGSVTALSNGCQLVYDSGAGEITIHDALKSNWDFIRLCQGQPAFGQGANAFRANNVEGNSEGYIPILDLRNILPPYGIRLEKATNQKITLKVRDTTTGVDRFDCIAYGFKRKY